MIYNGYTQKELDALLQLLEELKIPHALGADENLMEQTTKGDRGQRRGALNASYMKLEIEDDVLKKIDSQYYPRFEKFNIYPQYIDIPEGLEIPEEEVKSPLPSNTGKPKNKFFQLIMLIISLMMLYAAIRVRS